MGMLTGGISGGLAKYAGGYIPDGYGYQLAGRSLIGGVTGGITAELYGSDFGQGFRMGATTAAIGFMANDWLHETALPWLKEHIDFVRRGEELAGKARDQAEIKAQEIGGLNRGNADAWRHARWNQLMSEEMGAAKALTVSIGHELFDNQISGTQTSSDFIMDMHNNVVGATSGKHPDVLLQERKLVIVRP